MFEGDIRFDGHFVNNKREGRGRIIKESNQYFYVGTFCDDRKDGYGHDMVSEWPCFYQELGFMNNDLINYTKKLAPREVTQYEGQFQNDEHHGKGRMTWSLTKESYDG